LDFGKPRLNLAETQLKRKEEIVSDSDLKGMTASLATSAGATDIFPDIGKAIARCAIEILKSCDYHATETPSDDGFSACLP
jgi:hypothetical protein